MGKVLIFTCTVLFIGLHFAKDSNGISEYKKTQQEYDFEDLDVESITPNVDINYDKESENVGENHACECGTSLPPVDLTNRAVNSSLGNDTEKVQPGLVIQPLIIGGNRVRKIPWMVAITKYQHNKIPRWRVICGGVLLNQRYVLTAAHCIKDRYKDTLEVVFNVDDATAISNDPEVIRRKINRFIIHPSFDSTTIDNDIALIEIKIPLDFELLKLKVRAVCLPKRKDYANYLGTVSGWGYTSYGGVTTGNNSPDLLKVRLPILSHENCLKTKVSTKNNITENMLCAGYVEEGGKDACINDSGGPLTVEDSDDKSYVVGLVSWGIGCALEGFPGVYTRVSNYIPWIKKNTKSHWCGKIIK